MGDGGVELVTQCEVGEQARDGGGIQGIQNEG